MLGKGEIRKMSEAVVVAILTGGLSLIGTIITVLATSKKTEQSFRISQAVMEQEIKELTREVRLHNSYVTRVPVLEEKVSRLEEHEKRAAL